MGQRECARGRAGGSERLAGVAGAVAVGVELAGVGHAGTVVHVVGHTITVDVRGVEHRRPARPDVAAGALRVDPEGELRRRLRADLELHAEALIDDEVAGALTDAVGIHVAPNEPATLGLVEAVQVAGRALGPDVDVEGGRVGLGVQDQTLRRLCVEDVRVAAGRVLADVAPAEDVPADRRQVGARGVDDESSDRVVRGGHRAQGVTRAPVVFAVDQAVAVVVHAVAAGPVRRVFDLAGVAHAVAVRVLLPGVGRVDAVVHAVVDAVTVAIHVRTEARVVGEAHPLRAAADARAPFGTTDVVDELERQDAQLGAGNPGARVGHGVATREQAHGIHHVAALTRDVRVRRGAGADHVRGDRVALIVADGVGPVVKDDGGARVDEVEAAGDQLGVAETDLAGAGLSRAGHVQVLADGVERRVRDASALRVAGLAHGTGVAVVAGLTHGHGRVDAALGHVTLVAGAGVGVVADDRLTAAAGAGLTDRVLGAGVGIVAVLPLHDIRVVDAAEGRVASVGGAGVVVVAGDRSLLAAPRHARVGGAGAAVVTLAVVLALADLLAGPLEGRRRSRDVQVALLRETVRAALFARLTDLHQDALAVGRDVRADVPAAAVGNLVAGSVEHRLIAAPV